MNACVSRDRTVGAIGLFLLAIALYVWGLSPTIAWRDAPEFVTVAHTLDISHPAGSPTYALFAKLTTWLPIGSIATRINLFSAIAGALSIALIYLLLYDALGSSSQCLRQVSALSSSLALLLSESFWRMAEIAEVYTFQNLFLLILLSLLMHGRAQSPPLRVRSYWLFAFLYGLSAGVHATVALCAPAFLGFIALTEPRLCRGKALGFMAFFFLLGFTVYLYLPIRSLTHLAYDWGNPETLYQLLLHLTDHKDTSLQSSFVWPRLPHQLRLYGGHLVNEFSIIGCALGFVGLFYLSRRDRPLAFMSIVIFLGNVGFFMRVGWSAAWGFIPSYVMVSIWIGVGLYQVLAWISTLYAEHTIRLPRAVLYISLGSGIVASFGIAAVRHVHVTSQAHHYSAELYGKQLLEQLPPDALLFCEYSWFPLLYLQQVEHRRPDLTFILQGELFLPQYFPPVSADRFPNLAHIPIEKPVKMSAFDYFWQLATLNADDHALFLDPESQIHKALAGHLMPKGLLYAFHPGSQVTLTQQVLADHAKQLVASNEFILQTPFDGEAVSLLINKLNYLAGHFRYLQLPAEAEKMYLAALRLQPKSANARHNYGTLLMQMEQPKAALQQLYQAYLLNPVHPKFNQKLGELMLSLNSNDQAVVFLERALAYGGKDDETYAQLGLAYGRLGHRSAAQQNFKLALTYLQKLTHASPHLTGFQERIAWVQSNLKSLQSPQHDRDAK